MKFDQVERLDGSMMNCCFKLWRLSSPDDAFDQSAGSSDGSHLLATAVDENQRRFSFFNRTNGLYHFKMTKLQLSLVHHSTWADISPISKPEGKFWRLGTSFKPLRRRRRLDDIGHEMLRYRRNWSSSWTLTWPNIVVLTTKWWRLLHSGRSNVTRNGQYGRITTDSTTVGLSTTTVNSPVTYSIFK